MPRKPRFFLANVPIHVMQRGNNRLPIFFGDHDYRVYLNWLAEAAQRWNCAVHAYVLMTNHVHLLMTPVDTEGVSRAMQYLGRRYVPYVNGRYRRSGTLWEGRFKSSLVQSDGYLLACYRYIELNPVRAGMVAVPSAYPWSSYAANAAGERDPLVTPHAGYLALGNTDLERQQAYRSLFETALDDKMMREMRDCLQTGTPLGNERFRDEIERVVGRRVGQTTRGRPRKLPASDVQAPPGLQQLIKGL